MENLVERIANLVAKSLEQDFVFVKQSIPLDSYNYTRSIKPDVINTNIMELNNSERYKANKFKRYGWESSLIIDTKTKSVISITSISNLNHIRRRSNRNNFHYMTTILYNLNRKYNVYEQIQFDEISNIENKIYKKKFKEITNGLSKNIKGYTYYVVAYDFKYDKVIDMNMYLMDSYFNIVEKTEMMSYIKPDYIDLTAYEEVGIHETKTNIESINNSRINLSLKKKSMKEKGE